MPRRNPLRVSFRTVCTGLARRAAHRENRRRNHRSDARGVRPHRSSFAKINHFRQRHRLRPTRPAQDDARLTTWFCDAYASGQKGGVENSNGRLRRWLPRHLDIDPTSDQDIQEILLTWSLNCRSQIRWSLMIPVFWPSSRDSRQRDFRCSYSLRLSRPIENGSIAQARSARD
jgi:hypothetical protein